jgi:hypothetical protein
MAVIVVFTVLVAAYLWSIAPPKPTDKGDGIGLVIGFTFWIAMLLWVCGWMVWIAVAGPKRSRHNGE